MDSRVLLYPKSATIYSGVRVMKEFRIGQAIEAGPWRITILEVKESPCMVTPEGYFQALPTYKIVVVKVRVENMGPAEGAPFSNNPLPGQSKVTLITPKPEFVSMKEEERIHAIERMLFEEGKSIEEITNKYPLMSECSKHLSPYAFLHNLIGRYIERVEVPDKEFLERALEFKDPICSVNSGKAVEGYMLFIIRQDEKPSMLEIRYNQTLHRGPVTFRVRLV